MKNKRIYNTKMTTKPQYESDSLARVYTKTEEISKESKEEKIIKALKPSVINYKIDFISMAFLILAIFASLFVCVQYLKVQANIVTLKQEINMIEKQIVVLEKQNDALETTLRTERYDLEQIYEIAVRDLGMVYPNNNEIIYYENEDKGYFIQYGDIPD